MFNVHRVCAPAVLILLCVAIPGVHAQLGFDGPNTLNTNADSDTGFDDEPHIAGDGAGGWVAVWSSTENVGGGIGIDPDILVTRSSNNGATWSAPAALSSTAGMADALDDLPWVATDGSGNWVAAWYSSFNLGGTIDTDSDIFVSRSTDGGANWTPAAVLNGNATVDAGTDARVRVVTDAGGTWLAVWESTGNPVIPLGTDYEILFSRSVDNGANWSFPDALNNNAATDSGSDIAPHVATDGAGTWVSVWHSSDTLGGALDIDNDILFSVSTDNAMTWASPEALNTNAAGDTGNDLFPWIATDGLGTWVTVWQSDDTLGGALNSDLDILFSLSMDNGATWASPEALTAEMASDGFLFDVEPVVETDGAGNWAVVWWSSGDLGGSIDTDPDILGSHSDDNGATWSSPTPVNNTANIDSSMTVDQRPALANDGAGTWVAVWVSDHDLNAMAGTDEDIFVSRTISLPVELSVFTPD